MKEFTIQKNDAGQRLDKYIKKLLKDANSSFVYKMLRKKNIVLNGKKADGSERLSEGDGVTLYLSDETFQKFAGEEGGDGTYALLKDLSVPDLPVIYEDEDVLILNKPKGMLSQKAKPEDISANEYLIAYLIQKGELTAEACRTFHPSVCNRLDRNTSGLLLAGKSLKGLQELSAALKGRDVRKYYRCIVKGEITGGARLKGYLQKDGETNRVQVHTKRPETGEVVLPIEIAYEPVCAGRGFTELDVQLVTGRSHQIRAQLAAIGHPVAGDIKYGDREANMRLKREAHVTSQLLHAYRIVLPGRGEFVAEVDGGFRRARRLLGFTAESKPGAEGNV